MRISDWSSDVCSSDLQFASGRPRPAPARRSERRQAFPWGVCLYLVGRELERHGRERDVEVGVVIEPGDTVPDGLHRETVAERALVALVVEQRRSEEHTSELQSLMRISYAVFCLKKKKKQPHI